LFCLLSGGRDVQVVETQTAGARVAAAMRHWS
jgi:hypothetical protein